MGRPAALSRKMIVEGAVALVAEYGADALTARRLGEAIGCDPSALYRHFADMSDLQRAVGDHFLGAVRVSARSNEDWRAALRRICIALRAVQLQQPRLAVLVRAAPTRLANELRVTEALLRELSRGGFDAAKAAPAYHALVELTVGSATIDAGLASETWTVRRRIYRRWRLDYAALDAVRFPHSVVVAPHLYAGTADERFEFALDAMIAGLALCSG